MADYSLSVQPVDTWAAYFCEADRAEREGMTLTAKRQRAAGVHLRNAVTHMANICPDGYRVECRLVVSHVPDVNAILSAGDGR